MGNNLKDGPEIQVFLFSCNYIQINCFESTYVCIMSVIVTEQGKKQLSARCYFDLGKTAS